MQIRLTERARQQYGSAPPEVQRAFDRKLEFLAENLRHSSLHAKKYDELDLTRFRGHCRSHESAVGVFHGQAQTAGIYERVQG